MRSALLLTALLTGGCSAVLDFHECEADPDCAGRFDGGAGFCTSDHLCVGEIPEERLCTELLGANPNDPNTIMVAGFFRLSGMAGDKDTEMADGARLAITEIAGTNQRQIGMVMCDIALDSSAPTRSVTKAVEKYHVVGAVGPTTSGNTLAVAPLFVQYDLLLVTPSATSPAITDLPDNNLIWRTCAPDDFQGNALADFIPWNPTAVPSVSPRVNISYVASAYGMGLNSSFSSSWITKTGAGPVSSTPFNTGADPDMVVSHLAQDDPDYSVIIADDDASSIVKSLYNSGTAFRSTSKFLFTDGAKGPNLIGTMPNAGIAKRILGTAPANPSPPPSGQPASQPYTNFTKFALAYQAAYGSDPANTSFVGNTYDATYVLGLTVAGMPISSRPTGTAMAALMARMSGPGPTVNVGPIEFVKGVSALRGGGAIDFVGSSGNLTWNGYGDPTDSPIEVWGINPATRSFCHASPPPNDCPP